MLYWHPFSPELFGESDTDNDEVEVISYLFVCKVVSSYLNRTKVPDDLKNEAQHRLSVVLSSH